MRPFTPAQRAAITRPTHLLIEAGAGSGKTTTLVGKILYLLGAALPDIPPAPEAQRCALDRIAAITFTNAAAADLKESLRRAMREQAERTGERIWRSRVHQVERARIGTIHAFCGALLREFGLRAELDPGFRVLDEAETALLRASAVREEIFASMAAPSGDAAAPPLLARFGLRGTTQLVDEALRAGQATRDAYAKWCRGAAGGVDLERLRARLAEQGLDMWRRHDPEAARLAGALARLACQARDRLDVDLDRARALDFDALIYRTRDLLCERPQVLEALRARLAWLFIDEFQDTDPAQRDIAYALCGLPGDLAAAPRLCIVGDPKQSIYRFRRADVRLWNHVAEDFARLGSAPVRLDRNFRSRAPIVDFVNAVFAPLIGSAERARQDPNEVAYTPLAAHRAAAGGGAPVELLLVAGDNADARRAYEAERLAARMIELSRDPRAVREDARDGHPAADRAARWSDFAILFRTRTALGHYEAALRRHRVPYRVAGNTGFFDRREILDLRLLLAWLADPDDDAALAGILRSPLVALTDASLLRIRLAATPGPLRRGLSSAVLPEPDQRERLEEGRHWLESLRAVRDRVPVGALIERALDGSGYLAHLLFEEGGEVGAANVRKLLGMADAHPAWSLRELVDFMDAGADAAMESEAGVHTEGEDVVTLTTIHQAKGLEWPIVVLADLDSGIGAGHQDPRLFLDPEDGIALRIEDDEADEKEELPGAYVHLKARDRRLSRIEEKRVWYVAATRARERLILCLSTGAFTTMPNGAPAGHVVSIAEGAKTPGQWLCHALVEQGGGRGYDGTVGRWAVALCTEVEPPPLGEPPPEPPDPAELAAASGDAALAARIAPLPPPRDGRAHSATELMSFDASGEEHRRIYRLGLPPRSGAGSGAGGANGDGAAGVEVGTMLHGILERLRTLADLERLLDRELGGTMGPEDAEDARARLREELRAMVERTARNPRVAALLAEGDRAERELGFTWILPAGEAGEEPVIVRGALDLVGPGRPGVGDVIDYKSNRIAAGQEPREAEKYALQRDVYVAALLELTGAPPERFTFLFSRTGRGIETEPLPLEASAARGRVVAALKRMLQAPG